jgi:hypothetical protein
MPSSKRAKAKSRSKAPHRKRDPRAGPKSKNDQVAAKMSLTTEKNRKRAPGDKAASASGTATSTSSGSSDGSTLRSKDAPLLAEAKDGLCNAVDEDDTTTRCNAFLDDDDDEFCKAHATAWNRDDHLRSGMCNKKIIDKLQNYDTCAKMGCTKAKGSLLLCEGCPLCFHASCAPATAGFLADPRDEKDTFFICGLCASDAEKMALIPRKMRQPDGWKSGTKRRLPGSTVGYLEAAGLSPDKKKTDSLSSISGLKAKASAVAAATKKKYLDKISKLKSKLKRAKKSSSSSDDDGSDSSSSSSVVAVSSDSDSDSDSDDAEDIAARRSEKRARLREVKVVSASMGSISSLRTHPHSHVTEECNDPKCTIDKITGEYDWHAGNRFDFNSVARDFKALGAAAYNFLTSLQRANWHKERADRKVDKSSKGLSIPAYSETISLTDSQVVGFLEQEQLAFVSMVQAGLKRTPARVCGTRIRAIARIRRVLVESKYMAFHPEDFKNVSVASYVAALLSMAHKGSNNNNSYSTVTVTVYIS